MNKTLPFVAGSLQSELVDVQVDNPSYSPQHDGEKWNFRKTTARKNIRESAIETMFARKSIDEAQKKAADRFRALCESMGAAGARAFDYTSIRVDGGLQGSGMADKILYAGAEMNECHVILDSIDRGAFDILWSVAGMGRALSELRLSPRDMIWARAVMKASLDALAVHWGFKTPRVSPIRSAGSPAKAPATISVQEAAIRAKKSPDCIKRWCQKYGIGYQLSDNAPWRVDPFGLTIVLSGDAPALEDYRTATGC